jgi:hypothetical protein
MRKVQVDNGTEFPLTFALPVQETGIRLRYIKPRRPEQNGKVERSQGIDEEEFWSRSTFAELASAAQALTAWEHRYNYDRFSMALSASPRPRNLRRSQPPRPSRRPPPPSTNPLPTPSPLWTAPRSLLLSQHCAPVVLTTTTETRRPLLDQPLQPRQLG